MELLRSWLVAWLIVGSIMLSAALINSQIKFFFNKQMTKEREIKVKIVGFSKDGCLKLSNSLELCSDQRIILNNISTQYLISKLVKELPTIQDKLKINESCLKSLQTRCYRLTKWIIGKTVIIKVDRIIGSKIYGAAKLESFSDGSELWKIFDSCGCSLNPENLSSFQCISFK
jgi:hypothetical protein